jgi:hypothetical protein
MVISATSSHKRDGTEDKMKRSLMICLCMAALVVLASGCASDMSRLAGDYGTSYRLAKFNQVLNPDAEKNLEPVYGFSGVAAQKVLERYYTGFEKTTEGPTYTFKVGEK